MDKSICQLRGVWFGSLSCIVLFEASDLGLFFVFLFFLWDARHQWVQLKNGKENCYEV